MDFVFVMLDIKLCVLAFDKLRDVLVAERSELAGCLTG